MMAMGVSTMHKKRLMAWVGGASSIACVTIIAIWLTTCFASLVLRRPEGMLKFAGGRVHVIIPAGYPLEWPQGESVLVNCEAAQTELMIIREPAGLSFGGVPRFTKFAPLQMYSIIVPLWLCLLVMSLVTMWLWWLNRRVRPAGTCQSCGYDLTGNLSGRCPECGQAL